MRDDSARVRPLLGVALIVAGIAIGIGVGWIVFDEPLSNTADAVEVDQVEREVARVSGAGYATCQQRQYPETVWDCSATDGEGCFHAWTVAVDGEQMTATDKGMSERRVTCILRERRGG